MSTHSPLVSLLSRRLSFGLVVALLSVAFLSVGCGEREDPILRLSAAEALELGKAFLEEEKYTRARRHLIHAFEVEPNSRQGREALLLAADALYLQGSTDNYIKCEAKYRDFLNRFPTSELADYAQFKVAECLAARAERPDRDQEVTRDALGAYEELLRLFPESEHVPEARQRMRDMLDRLAEHELVIGVFYNRYAGRGICRAAIGRLEYLREEYPEFRRMDEALYHLLVAYTRCEQPTKAEEALATLRRRYPDSEFLEDAAEWEEDELKELSAVKAAEEAVRKAVEERQKAEEAEAAAGEAEGS